MAPELKGDLSPVPEKRSSSSNLRKKRLIVNKFQEIKVDEQVKKRILIQNGRFSKSRETNKDNRIKAIVNHKFDEVVMECMGRRNVGLRQAMMEQRGDLIKEEFKRTVSSIPQRAASMSAIRIGDNVCIGTSEMKKKIDKIRYSNKRSPRESEKYATEEDYCL